MRKKTLLTAALISALLSSAVAGTQSNLLAKANFVFPPANPVITVESPTNRTYNNNTLFLNVTVATYKTGYPGGPDSDETRLFTYTLDGGETENITITNASVAGSPGGYVFFAGSMRLPELTEGLHNLIARVVFVYDNPTSEEYIVTVIHTESKSTVFFRVDTAPQNISILMPKNNTYAPTEVPLQFFIDEPASWIGYSLDGQENVTVTGDMKLPELSVGQHTLTLYANDASGNPAASKTITFSVAEPFPLALIAAASCAVVTFELITYFRKRRR